MGLVVLTVGLLAAASPARFVERPCADPRLEPLVRCGVVEVPEDRAAPFGRRIGLNIMILPSTSPEPDLPPLFDLEGGPGLPATKNAGFYLTVGAGFRARRPIVLLDQRGTGGSNPLDCAELNAPEDAYREMLAVEAVISCRERLAARADLKFYGTDDAALDLDTVRTALGYDRIDLFALSYGTTVALRFMTAFPGRVRAAVLMGTAPPDLMPPRHHATAGQRALDLLFEDCAADDACRSRFPVPASDLARALARVEQETGISSEVFAEKIRTLLYAPAGARQIPWLLNRAAEGDFEPFREATRPRDPLPYSDGMFLSVTCSEGIRLLDYEEAASDARATRFGDYRLRRQRAACEHWPSGEAAPDHLGPVASDAAILMISGRLDPVTPPEWADRVARALPNARHVELRHGGHILDGLAGADTCFDPLLMRFFETGDAAELDVGCLEDMRPPPFRTGNR